MTRERINQINGYLEGFYASDNGDAAWEKTTLIEELLAEVQRLQSINERMSGGSEAV